MFTKHLRQKIFIYRTMKNANIGNKGDIVKTKITAQNFDKISIKRDIYATEDR